MTMEPKLIEIPGIPGKLREQTLDEFLSVLAPDHLARQQLNEIRNQALKSVELSTQLMQANEKILQLQTLLMAPKQAERQGFGAASQVVHELHQPPNKYVPDTDLAKPADMPELVSVPDPVEFPKAKCPNCGDMVSTRPGTWGIHQARKHPQNRAPRPT